MRLNKRCLSCSVEKTLGAPDDHQVVGDRPEHDLAVQGVRPPAAQGGAEPALDHGENSLDLPALTVGPARKGPMQLPPPAPADRVPRPTVAGPASPRRGDDAAHAQLLPTAPVHAFALVPRVAQQRGEAVAPQRRLEQRGQLHHVRPRPAVDHGREDQMAARLAEGRELGETPLVVPRLAPGAPGVVDRDVARLQPSRVNGRRAARRRDQAVLTSEGDRRIEEARGAVFFSSRASA